MTDQEKMADDQKPEEMTIDDAAVKAQVETSKPRDASLGSKSSSVLNKPAKRRITPMAID